MSRSGTALATNPAAAMGKCGLDSTVSPESAFPRNLGICVLHPRFLGNADSGETVESWEMLTQAKQLNQVHKFPDFWEMLTQAKQLNPGLVYKFPDFWELLTQAKQLNPGLISP